MKTPKVQKKKLKWTVEFEVSPLWVADGFDLDEWGALEMLAQRLGWANIDQELAARVIKKPDAALIDGLQCGTVGFPGDDEGN